MEEEHEYEVTFKPMYIIATSPEEAEQKVIDEVANGNLEIKDVIETQDGTVGYDKLQPFAGMVSVW